MHRTNRPCRSGTSSLRCHADSTERSLGSIFRDTRPDILESPGADVGTQYRSAIFYNSEAQQATAEAALQQAQGDFENRIVTEIAPASAFYEAEDYHQAYYELNGEAPYCRAVVAPKMQKFGMH